jgi:hypothetical protein
VADRQIESEFAAFLKERARLRTSLQTAVAQGNLALVNPAPYALLDQGSYGWPVSAQVEGKALAVNADPSIDVAETHLGWQLQIDVLESYRKQLAASRQGRREMLKHLAQSLEANRAHEGLLAQAVTGTYHSRETNA